MPKSETERDARRRYRKIFTSLWRHDIFRGLPSDEKVMTLYILSGPQTNRIGLFLFSDGTAHEDLGIALAAVKKRRVAACKAFNWEYDEQARVLWVPSWWVWNEPTENPKNFRGALADLNELPKTPLLVKFCNNLSGIPVSLHSLITDRTVFEQCSDGARSQGTGNREQRTESREQGVPPATLIELWNATVHSLPKAEAVSPDRLRHAKARLAEQPNLDTWAVMFVRMDASDFLTGRRPGREHPSWRADVDFALKAGTFGKVLEGKYDNRLTLAKPAKDGYQPWACPHVDECSNPGTCAHKNNMPEKYPVKQAVTA